MSCLLTVSGTDLHIEDLLEQLRIEPYRFWRKGESRLETRPDLLNDHSGASFDVSEADIGEHDQQISDAISFLQENLEDIQRMKTFPGVDEVGVDFGLEFKDSFAPSDYLPAELIALAGRAGISICLSHYPTEESKWKYVGKEDNRAIELHDSTLASEREPECLEDFEP